jgi:small subunit ribosomal protein S4
MSKRIQAKYKINRRLRCNLWGRPKSPFNRREYGPGQHGQRRRKPSDYGLQLMAKQRLKGYYGNIGEKQFRKYYEAATRRKGDTSENLIELLERRLDAVVYRAKFVPTVFAARQFVNHGHIRVNGKRVNIPSYMVRDGDVIEIKQKSRELPLVVEAIASTERDVPDYLNVNFDKLTCTFVRAPSFAKQDVPYPVHMEPNLVIEFYSR